MDNITRYKVRYIYVNPGRGGPLRGSQEFPIPAAGPRVMKKGDTFYAVFGLARVTSVSAIKKDEDPYRGVSGGEAEVNWVNTHRARNGY